MSRTRQNLYGLTMLALIITAYILDGVLFPA